MLFIVAGIQWGMFGGEFWYIVGCEVLNRPRLSEPGRREERGLAALNILQFQADHHYHGTETRDNYHWIFMDFTGPWQSDV